MNPLKIRETIQLLTEDQLKQLRYAFESEIAQYVIIDANIFVGVNVQFNPKLTIEDSQGAWSCGRVKDER